MALAAASFLLVLRMYVLCPSVILFPPWVGIYGGHQRRHLERKYGRSGDRSHRMGDQQCVPHPR
jgi:hypothetical protein